jgi:hypothetical protein
VKMFCNTTCFPFQMKQRFRRTGIGASPYTDNLPEFGRKM